MTPIAVGFLLVKVTILFVGGLAALRARKESPAALRHLICLLPIAASILLPLTLIGTHAAIPIGIESLTGSVTAAAYPSRDANSATVLFELWLTGALLLLLRLAVGHWRLYRIVCTSQKVGTREGIPVFSAEVPVPLVTGLWRPAILMPVAATSWPTSHYEAALRHECAHVERRDLWSSLIAGIASAIWWFHPLVWILTSKQTAEQEFACDDAVLSGGVDTATYAGALLGAVELPLRFSRLGSPMFTKNDLTRRIQRLADYQPPTPLSPHILRRIALAFAVTLTLAALLGPVAAQNPIYKIGGDVTSPRVIEKVDPDYPPDAKAEKVQGTVALHVVILATGIAGDMAVEKSPDPRLDEAAIAAVRQWKFAPGTLKGQPVAVQANIELNFHLK